MPSAALTLQIRVHPDLVSLCTTILEQGNGDITLRDLEPLIQSGLQHEQAPGQWAGWPPRKYHAHLTGWVVAANDSMPTRCTIHPGGLLTHDDLSPK